MNFNSLEFIVFSCAAVLILIAVRGGTARVLAINALNLFFVGTFLSSIEAALPLAVFVALGYGAIYASARTGPGGLVGLVGIVIVVFIWLKKYSIIGFLPLLHYPYLIVGISYILFRVIHLMVDVGQAVRPCPRPLDYLAYVLFFLGYVSGPIQRFGDFDGQLRNPAFPELTGIHRAFGRIIFGFFLAGFATVATSYAFGLLETRAYDALTPGKIGLSAFIPIAGAMGVFAIHLYLNFSGYMEIVIGIGMLCGFRLPENFDQPYLCRNFLDFWSRWHITLSEWFKYYLFNPVVMALSRRFGSRSAAPYLGAVGFFITFLVMGIWHGSTIIYVFYGLFLGCGVTVNKLYQIEIVSWIGRQGYKALCGRMWYLHLSRAIAISYFAMAITCMWIAPEKAALFVSSNGLILALTAFLAMTLAVIVASVVMESMSRLLRPPMDAVQRRWMVASPAWNAPAWTAAKLFVVANLVLIARSSAPEFVYKGF